MNAKLVLDNVAVDRTALVDGRAQTLRILSGINASVSPGGRLAIIGPSGSGKTSLLRLINRLDEPAEGRVLLDDTDIRRLDPVAVRRRIGLVFQQPFVFDLTVRENLAYPCALARKTLPDDQAKALIREFGLPESFLERRGPQLSGGQQQRVAIARALALAPEVLLLDEPTSALDEESAGIVMESLLRRNRDGLTLVMVTHSPDILRRLNCPVLLVHEGVANGFPDAETALQAVTRAQIRME